MSRPSTLVTGAAGFNQAAFVLEAVPSVEAGMPMLVDRCRSYSGANA